MTIRKPHLRDLLRECTGPDKTFQALARINACGLPPVAVIALNAMVLSNTTDINVRTLAQMAGTDASAMDHAAIALKHSQLCRYTMGRLIVTDPEVLRVMQDVEADRKRLSAADLARGIGRDEAPEAVVIEMPLKKKGNKAKE